MKTTLETITQYINRIDLEISKLNEENGKEKQRQDRMLLKCKELILKDVLTDQELSDLSCFIFSSMDDVFPMIPNLFSDVVDKIDEEYRQTGSIREGLLTLLENIVSKEGFSLFHSEENIEAFKKLYALRFSNNISLIAVLNYLMDYNTIISNAARFGSVDQMRSISKRVRNFCEYLLLQGVNLSSPKIKVCKNQTSRQTS